MSHCCTGTDFQTSEYLPCRLSQVCSFSKTLCLKSNSLCSCSKSVFLWHPTYMQPVQSLPKGVTVTPQGHALAGFKLARLNTGSRGAKPAGS